MRQVNSQLKSEGCTLDDGSVCRMREARPHARLPAYYGHGVLPSTSSHGYGVFPSTSPVRQADFTGLAMVEGLCYATYLEEAKRRRA